MSLPILIQGGMGIGVSSWQLARAVSHLGQLGVVSGTGLDMILVRKLQDGDLDGNLRRAFRHFPQQEIVERVMSQFYIHGGRAKNHPYAQLPLLSRKISKDRIEIIILANFSEVFLAKEGHPFGVGINLLEKVQIPTLPSLYGAMLAGVDYVLMGAGIPNEIPGALDLLSRHRHTELSFGVLNSSPHPFKLRFDPKEFLKLSFPFPLRRPKFFPIISSAILGASLVKKANGKIDGFVVEGSTAGGHNAPPRGELHLSESGEPIYSDRDRVDLEKLKKLDLPFWLAGSFGSHEKLKEARNSGAVGIQVGTAFAFCKESGLDERFKMAVIEDVLQNRVHVFTDPYASPTGFPFKVVQMKESLSDKSIAESRERRCDLGYLRQAYQRDDGTLGYRCPAEPVQDFIRKGGSIEKTEGRKCLCNALFANIGLGQIKKDGTPELPLITAGDDCQSLKQWISNDKKSYAARDVVETLLGDITSIHD